MANYSKWEGFGDSDDEEPLPRPSRRTKDVPLAECMVGEAASAAKRATSAKAAGHAPNPMDDLFTLGKGASAAELIEKMKAMPDSAKQQFLKDIGPDVIEQAMGMDLDGCHEPRRQQDKPGPPVGAERSAGRDGARRGPEETGRQGALLGSRVVVSGLKARPELNGKGGVCTDFVPAKGRYAVRVDGERDAVLLKPANLDVGPAVDG